MHDINHTFSSVKRLAELLKLNEPRLKEILLHDSYQTFIVPKKKNGRTRRIESPAPGLKKIQKKLNFIFQYIYHWHQPGCVYGFTKHYRWQKTNTNILEHASIHAGKKHILSVDIMDFFPSISSARIYDTFLHFPFSFNEDVSICLTALVTYNRHLPQGAPTSPIMSNFVFYKSDLALEQLAGIHGIRYSRYADDLVFSSDEFISKEFLFGIWEVLRDAGFQMNNEKIRFRSNSRCQVVTGLTVNEKPNISRNYIRRLRAVLHDWETNGTDAAALRYFLHGNSHIPAGSHAFRESLYGMIQYVGMVRGKDDDLYSKLKQRFEDMNAACFR